VELGPETASQGRKLRAQFGAARPVWIAGSTHAGEDEQVLDAHLLLKERPDALLLLVPRHKDRFQSVADMLARRGVRFERRSGGIVPDTGVSVLLVDTMGELQVLYAAADVAFVGGSLVPIGGHNLLEPAALGLPVLTGPYQFNNKEIAGLLLNRGAALQAANAQELAGLLQRLLDNPAERHRIGSIGRGIVESNRGSVSRLLDLIEPRLVEPPLVEPRPAEHPSATR
jgi:3-deoxy-D-manno-octulosonic-acid transferase